MLTPPHGYSELLKLGDPRKYIRQDGTIDSPAWESAMGFTLIEFPEPLQLSFGSPYQTAHGMRVHPVSAPAWTQAFNLLEKEGLWLDLHTFGGSYNFRTQRGYDSVLSTHCWALAADFDTKNLPLGSDPSKMNPAIVQIFESLNFVWGGRFKRPDPQHFQWVTGY